MTKEIQSIIPITNSELLPMVASLSKEGWRMIQILCITTESSWELSYSFGLEYEIRNIRLSLAKNESVNSITSVFPAAFLYENEIKDLFGAPIENIQDDWKGKVYDVAKDKPFSKISFIPPSSEKGGLPLNIDALKTRGE